MQNKLRRYLVNTIFNSKSQTEPVNSKETTVTLIYRGQIYHRQIDRHPRSNQLNRTLVYRGHVYETRAAQTPPAVTKIISLIYRGQIYYRSIPQIRPDRIYHQPRALNWRWQISSKN